MYHHQYVAVQCSPFQICECFVPRHVTGKRVKCATPNAENYENQSRLGLFVVYCVTSSEGTCNSLPVSGGSSKCGTKPAFVSSVES